MDPFQQKASCFNAPRDDTLSRAPDQRSHPPLYALGLLHLTIDLHALVGRAARCGNLDSFVR
jgi:hypothetical protein